MRIKKMIAPIIITILLVIWLLLYLWGWSYIPINYWVKAMVIILLVFIIGASIFVLIERIREIKEGEEDDIGKY